MSISASDPGAPQGHVPAVPEAVTTPTWHEVAVAVSGPPFPDEIARMANEFFGAIPRQPSALSPPAGAVELPESSQVAATEVASQPAATSNPPSAGLPFGDLDLRLVPASLVDTSSSGALTPYVVGGSGPSPHQAAFGLESAPTALAASRETPSPRYPRAEADLRSLPAWLEGELGVPGSLALDARAEPQGKPFYFVSEEEAVASPRLAAPARAGEFEFLRELVPELGPVGRPFDPQAIRRDFPILEEQVNGHPLIWLDNAATTQKPRSVIERISSFYEHENSNVHRAAHTLAARATDAYEASRDQVRQFLNAPSTREIVFVRGATEAINLVAQSWGRRHVKSGDEVLISWLEHHANIVPWQQLCSETGAKLCVAPVDDTGQVILEEYGKLLTSRTRLVAFSQVSNALGTVTPVYEMTQMAHRVGALVLVDGAQAVSHLRVDVQALDSDFYAFSGHKVFGPTGIRALFGRSGLLDTMPPWQGGGNMITDVTFEKTSYQPAPGRFEAGTGNIADAVGLGAALDYVNSIGIENVTRYEHELLGYATRELSRVPGLSIIGSAREKAGVISFILEGTRTENVGAMLDREGIAIRSGHHCAQPIVRRFGLESTVRASLAPYNTCEDIDALVAALRRIQAGRSG